jgi:hypothetical protein
MLTFRHSGLFVLCLALLAAACKDSSPVDTAPSPDNLWQPCKVSAIGATVLSIVTGRNGILFAILGSDVARSTDSGNTWSALTASPSGFSKLIVDKAGNLYGNVNGVSRSTDDGNSWTPLGGDPRGATGLTLIANEWILTVSQGGATCYRSTNMGDTWMKASDLPGLGEGEEAIYNQKTNTVYLKTSAHGANINEWSSIDNGTTWTFVRNFAGISVYYPNFCMTVDSTGRLWVLDQDGHIFRDNLEVGHSSFGSPYVFPYLFRADSSRWQALVLQADPSGLLLLGGNGFHFSSDGGVSWVTNSSGLIDNVVTAIGIQPGGMVLVGTSSGKIYRSTRPVTK